ncbi:MAG: polyprenyl synthetase family protein [Pseudoxanthomonas suwonensis]|nr:polyprenyl synthetase family protein [Pseudoxanthomonas suwonensis]
MPEALQPRLAQWRERIDAAITRALPARQARPQRLHAAMHHAALLGGKRMRPLLVYATGTALGADASLLDAPAVAVELIHAYSLVHDDLPAMDDDALRRGQPTVHVAFDEATAILAGDALQALAFETLANATASEPAVRVAMLAELSRAAGAAGMCGGQALDIDATGEPSGVDLAALRELHARKTGALLRAGVRMGALAAGADDHARTALDRYADALGLAFQIRDDILDVEGDSTTLGKTAGKDAAQAKATYPALMGLEASRRQLQQLSDTMADALSALDGRAEMLSLLGRQVVERNH